jgi:OOP family OmpA-OmpF porin
MKKLLIAAALSTTFLAGPAAAQMYLGAGVGASKTDAHETSGKLYGGMQFNPAFGLELGYTDLGNYHGSRVDSWSLAGTGTLPLGERWSLLGKLGAAWNRPHFNGASNHTDLLAGVGIGYSMTKNLGLRLEYEDFGKLSNINTGNNSKGRNIGLSLKYAF